MSEPERWLTSTDAPGGMSEMLSAAQKVGPSAIERAALAGKLGVATSGLWIAPVLKGLFASAVVAGGVWGVTTFGGTPEAAPSAQAQATDTSPSAGLVPIPATDSPVEAAELEGAQPQLEESLAEQPSKAPEKRVGISKNEPTKPSEISLIGRAKSAVETSPREALSALSEHAKLYPTGVLAEEREVLRIRALKNLGREKAAEEQQEKFRKEHPESVHHVP